MEYGNCMLFVDIKYKAKCIFQPASSVVLMRFNVVMGPVFIKTSGAIQCWIALTDRTKLIVKRVMFVQTFCITLSTHTTEILCH